MEDDLNFELHSFLGYQEQNHEVRRLNKLYKLSNNLIKQLLKDILFRIYRSINLKLESITEICIERYFIIYKGVCPIKKEKDKISMNCCLTKEDYIRLGCIDENCMDFMSFTTETVVFSEEMRVKRGLREYSCNKETFSGSESDILDLSLLESLNNKEESINGLLFVTPDNNPLKNNRCIDLNTHQESEIYNITYYDSFYKKDVWIFETLNNILPELDGYSEKDRKLLL